MSHRFGKQAVGKQAFAVGVVLVAGAIACQGQVVLGNGDGPGSAGQTPTATGTCNAGLVICSDVCTDLSASNANCGECGKACGAGSTCTASGCSASAAGDASAGGGDATTATSNGCVDTPTVPVGGACTESWQCIGGYQCTDGSCGPGLATETGVGCTGLGVNGDACSATLPCATPFVCLASVCTAPPVTDAGAPDATTDIPDAPWPVGEPVLASMSDFVVGPQGYCITQLGASEGTFAPLVPDTSASTAAQLTTLTSLMVGQWIGTVTTAWLSPYTGTITFTGDGHFAAGSGPATAQGAIDQDAELPRPDVGFGLIENPPIFYYGGNEWCEDTNTWSLTAVASDGTASGTIHYASKLTGPTDCVDDSPIELRTAALDDTGNRLQLTLYSAGYGPISLDLYRACPTTP